MSTRQQQSFLKNNSNKHGNSISVRVNYKTHPINSEAKIKPHKRQCRKNTLLVENVTYKSQCTFALPVQLLEH